MEWNGITVKRIEFDDYGRIRVIEFYDGAGFTNVMKAVCQYKINGGMPRMVEEAVILSSAEGRNGLQYPPDPKQDPS